VSAAAAHHFWDRPGGGELVMAVIAAAAEKMGLNPVLTSLTHFDGSRYREWFGIDLSKYPAISGRLSLKTFGLYMRPQAKLPQIARSPVPPPPASLPSRVRHRFATPRRRYTDPATPDAVIATSKPGNTSKV